MDGNGITKIKHMSWNYRVLVFVQGDETVTQICEVYYDKEGKPNGYTDKNIVASSTGKEGLVWMLSMYKDALKKPMLYGGDKFPQEYERV